MTEQGSSFERNEKQGSSIGIIGVRDEERKEIESLLADNPANLKIIEGCACSGRKVLDADYFKGEISVLDALEGLAELYSLTAETFSLRVVIPAWLCRDGRDEIDSGLLKYYLQAAEKIIK